MTVNRQLTLYIRSDGRNIVKDGDPPQSVAPGAVLYAYAVIQGGPIGDFYQPFAASFNGQAGSGITEPSYAVDLNGSELAAVRFTAPATPGTYRVTADVPLTTGCAYTATMSADVAVVAPAAPAPPPSDATAPTVLVMGALARTGAKVTLTYLIQDEEGPTREVVDIRKSIASRPIASWTSRLARKESWHRVSVVLPRRIAPGRWKWCVTSIDRAGNRSRRACGNLAVV